MNKQLRKKNSFLYIVKKGKKSVRITEKTCQPGWQ